MIAVGCGRGRKFMKLVLKIAHKGTCSECALEYLPLGVMFIQNITYNGNRYDPTKRQCREREKSDETFSFNTLIMNRIFIIFPSSKYRIFSIK